MEMMKSKMDMMSNVDKKPISRRRVMAYAWMGQRLL